MATKNGKKCITEKRPKMLKEFLQEMNNHPSTTTSPHRLADADPTVNVLLDQHATTAAASTLPRSRSRSRAAAEAAFTSFQKLLNAVKSIQRSSSSSSATSPPLTLTRSISGSLVDRFFVKKKNKSYYSKSNNNNNNDGIMNKIKVRDILRWKSFRDFEEPTKPLVSSHWDGVTRRLTITDSDILFEEDGPTFSTSSSRNSSGDGLRLRSSRSESSGSSWGENELPCWWGNSSEEEGKKWDQNKDDVVSTISDVGPKEDNHKVAIMEDDKEQHSPVSVLDSPFREEISDHEFESSFDKILANMEKTKQSLLQRIQSFEILAGVSNDQDEDDDEELVEYVQQEQEDDPTEADSVIIGAKTMAYINKAMGKLIRGDQGLEVKEMCKKDMEKQGQWRVFGEKEEELGAELEFHVLSDLVDEVLVDLFGSARYRNVDY